MFAQRLNIVYDSDTINDIYQIQFVIANTGDVPITRPIKPLQLTLFENSCVLDYNIIHKEPASRDLNMKIDNKNEITFDFLLLNPNEYFVVKFLVKGSLPEPEKQNNIR